MPLHVDATRDVRRPLVALSIGVAILLLIACVNVGSLLVARAAARSRETAVKAALGATVGRLVRQHVVESLVLGALGAGLGLLLGRWGLAALLSRHTRRAQPAAAGVGGHAGGRGLHPDRAALDGRSSRPRRSPRRRRVGVARALQHDARRAGGGRHRLRAALTVAQIALSVVLVVGALLLVRTVQRIQQVDPGLPRRRRAVVPRRAARARAIPIRTPSTPSRASCRTALAALPGATAASAVSHAPYDHVPNWGGPFLAVEGADASTAPQADYRAVAPGLMELLGVQLVEGRLFTESDDHHGAPVTIVDERLARRTWPGESALGRRLAVDPSVAGTPATWTTVVGVVRHVRHRSPIEEVRDQVYFPERQVPRNPGGLRDQDRRSTRRR